ncbi:hypothetical protein [Roseateles sp.]|uniref:hypothetical protein n=1 Tax=Roseateles sp. TaxID=1971397 RepID=UPI0031D997FE
MEPISKDQRAMAERIAAYGRKNGIQQHLIDAAVKFAYIESKLGARESKGNNADGLFQYKPMPWKERHQKSLGTDRWSVDNQIVAMYRDLQRFERRYNDLSNPRIPRQSVTLEEYLYIKHHDGPNSGDFSPRVTSPDSPTGSWCTGATTPPTTPPSSSRRRRPASRLSAIPGRSRWVCPT